MTCPCGSALVGIQADPATGRWVYFKCEVCGRQFKSAEPRGPDGEARWRQQYDRDNEGCEDPELVKWAWQKRDYKQRGQEEAPLTGQKRKHEYDYMSRKPTDSPEDGWTQAQAKENRRE